MSVGPLTGLISSVAGSPLAQTKGAEIERSHQDASSQTRRVESAQRSESAAGIGETDGQEHETAERDADGRRLWEKTDRKAAEGDDSPPGKPRQSKDTTGQSGTQLDLCG